MKAGKAQIEAFTDDLPFNVMLLDNNMLIRWANKAALRVSANAVGRKCYEAYGCKDGQCHGCYCKKAIQGGQVETDIVFHSEHVMGAGFWENIAIPVANNSGRIIGAFNVSINVTKFVNVGKELEHDEFHAQLLNNSPNPIAVFDQDCAIRYVNPALEKLAGYTHLELVGREPPFPWWCDEHRKKLKSIKKSMLKGFSGSEYSFRKKNGELFWVIINSVPVQVGGETKFIVSNWVNITEQKQRSDNLQSYAWQVTKGQEDERKRLAREMHDVTIQSLSCLCQDLDALLGKKVEISSEVASSLVTMRGKLDQIVEETRRFSHRLRPGILDRFGLTPSLETLIDEMDGGKELVCHLCVTGSERRLSHDIESALYRIAQEALSNIRKHSMATTANLKLRYYKQKVELVISDDGCGFTVPKVLGNMTREGKFGLLGIEERVGLLGGGFLVTSELGRGTRLKIGLPG